MAQFHANDRLSVDLIALVEYCEDVLPRLYLLCLVTYVILLGNSSDNGWFGTVMVTSIDEAITELGGVLSAEREPLSAIFLRIFSVALLGNNLQRRGVIRSVHIEFLLTCWKDINQLWIRFGQSGSKVRLEERLVGREAMLDLIQVPLKALADLDLTEEEYSDQVCPIILNELAEGEDELSQALVFKSLLYCFPASLNLSCVDLLLKSIQSPLIKSNLIALIDALLTRETSGELWMAVSRVLKTLKLPTEAYIIRICASFLRQQPDETVSEEIFSLLSVLVTDKCIPEWGEFLRQAVHLYEPVPALILAVTRNTRNDLETSVSLAIKSEDILLLSEILSKDTLESNIDRLESLLSPLQSQEFTGLKFEDLLNVSISNPDNLILGLLGAKVAISYDQIGKLESYRDSKRSHVNGLLMPLRLHFGPDAPSFHFVTILAKLAMDETDESKLYQMISKCILTVEKGLSDSTVQEKVVDMILELCEAKISLLRPQDIEAPLSAIHKIIKRELDLNHRTRSLITLIHLTLKHKSTQELFGCILDDCTSHIDKEHSMNFFRVCTEAYEIYPGAFPKRATKLNEHFWQLRDLLEGPVVSEYNQLWAIWTATIPQNSLSTLEALQDTLDD